MSTRWRFRWCETFTPFNGDPTGGDPDDDFHQSNNSDEEDETGEEGDKGLEGDSEEDVANCDDDECDKFNETIDQIVQNSDCEQIKSVACTDTEQVDWINDFLANENISYPCNPEMTNEQALCDIMPNSIDVSTSDINGIIPSSKFNNCKMVACVWNMLDHSGNSVFSDNLCALMNDIENNLSLDLGAAASGSTVISGRNTIRMRFDEDDCENGDILDIAETILHESFHVKFRYQYLEENSNITESEFLDAWRDYAVENFGYTYNEHHIMILKYIDDIAAGLAEFDNNQFSPEHYKFLVWQGLSFHWQGFFDDSTVQNWNNKYKLMQDGVGNRTCD